MADQAAEYRRAWEAFEQLERLSPHRADWATWAAGHHCHRLLALLVRDPAALEAIDAVQRSLRHLDGLELHPPEFLHVTLQWLGFDGELAYDADALGRSLARAPAFQLELGGLAAFHSAVVLEVHSGGRLLDLRRRIRAVGGESLARLDPFDGYLFHLTLGYFVDARVRLAAVRAAIRPLRAHATARVRVDEVALVELPTDQQVAYPPFAPLRCFALRASR